MRSVPARAALLGALFAALVTLPGLGTGTLWDNSETAYGEVAREIVRGGDWIVMHLNGQPWFVQPPLYFWIAASFAKAFGIAPFALRLPSALATVAMGGAVGYATARIAGGRAGMIAALVLSTSLMQAIVGRLAIMDALLDLAVAATILWWFRACDPAGAARRRDAALVLGALAAAIGMLAKGPVAPVIALLVVVLWAAWERAAGRLAPPRPRALALGVAAFVALTAPWFVALGLRGGPHGVVELIGHYTFGRYTGVIENQSGPVWYYVPVLILGFFPWIAFLPVALRAAWREARSPDGAFARLALVWFVVPFLFFSFASTKLPNYVALLLPALAIVVGLWFERVAAGAERRAATISAATIPAFVGCVALAIVVFSRTNGLGPDVAALAPQLAVLAVVMLGGSLATTIAIARPSSAAVAPYVLAVTSGALVLFIAFVAEPAAEAFKPIPPLARIIEARAKPDDRIAIRGVSGGNGLLFLTRPPIDDISTAPQAYVSVICPFSDAWIVTRTNDVASLIALAHRLQRTADLIAESPSRPRPSAALLHVHGASCPTDWLETPVNPTLPTTPIPQKTQTPTHR